MSNDFPDTPSRLGAAKPNRHKEFDGEDCHSSYQGQRAARFIDPSVPYHIISRCFQGRMLMRPNRDLNRMIAGVVGRVQAKPEMAGFELYCIAFMSNHMHAMVKGSARQVSQFMAFVKREISRRWQQPGVAWEGTKWHRYMATALVQNDAQVACLKYILSQGVKEGLVTRPGEWPGVHSAAALFSSRPIHGLWTNYTAYHQANRGQKKSPVGRYQTNYEIKHATIPAWKSESKAWIRTRLDLIEQEIVDEGSKSRSGTKPSGARMANQVDILSSRRLPTGPWFTERKAMVVWGQTRHLETKAYLDRYWEFQRAHSAAANSLRAGDLAVVFPESAFRPWSYVTAA